MKEKYIMGVLDRPSAIDFSLQCLIQELVELAEVCQMDNENQGIFLGNSIRMNT